MDQAANALIYVGTYTTPRHAPVKALGIYTYAVDRSTGELSFASKIPKVSNPSHLAIRPGQRYLYAVIDVRTMNGKPGGGVSAFGINRTTGALAFLNSQPSPGANPGHVSLDRTGRYVLVASRASGDIAIYPIEASGTLGPASDVVQTADSAQAADRTVTHPAISIEVDPTNRYALVADPEFDLILVYQVDLNRGRLIANSPGGFIAQPRARPRRLDFHPTGRVVYVVNEESSVSVLAFDLTAGSLRELQTVSSLPENFQGQTIGADIHVAPSGRFLYALNSGHDSIASFEIDPESGGLTIVGWESTQGTAPGSFAIDPSGTLVVVANQDTSTLVSFRTDPDSGALQPTGHSLVVPTPVCVKFSAIEIQ